MFSSRGKGNLIGLTIVSAILLILLTSPLIAQEEVNFDFPFDRSLNGKIRWTGGPHVYGNTDTLALFYSGLGSGIDFAGTKENESFDVLAMESGKVIDKRRNGGLGWQVAIEHSDGTVLIYGHLASFESDYELEDHVSKGHKLGVAGRSGGQKYIHLHVELRDGSDECTLLIQYCILPGGIGGNPLSWDGRFILSWQIFEYRDAEMTNTSFNYDGLAIDRAFHPFDPVPYRGFTYKDKNKDGISSCAGISPCVRTINTFLPVGYTCPNEGYCETLNPLPRIDGQPSTGMDGIEFAGHGYFALEQDYESGNEIAAAFESTNVAVGGAETISPTLSEKAEVSIAEIASTQVTDKDYGVETIFTPDGNRLIVKVHKEIRILSVPGLELISSIETPEWERINIGTTIDNNYVVALQSRVQVRDTETSSIVRELYPCQYFTQCDPWTFNAESSRGAVVATIDSPERLATAEAAAITGGGYSTSRMAQHPAPKMIVIFDMVSGEILQTIDISDLYTNSFQNVSKLQFSQDGSLIAVNISGVGVAVWNISSAQRLGVIESYGRWSLRPNSQTLATDGSKQIKLHSLQSEQETTISDFDWTVFEGGFVFTHDGRILISTYFNSQTRREGFIRLWNVDTGQNVATIDTERKGYCISVSSTNSRIAIAFADGTVKLYKIE